MLNRIILSTAVATALVAAAPAQAQLQRKDLSIDTALVIATTAMAHCKGQGYAVSVAIVGRNGEILAHLRGDNTGPHTMDNSFRKAYTSRTFRIPSGEMYDRLKKDPAQGAVFLPNVVPARGALPVKIGDDVVGAAGASGAPGGERDEVCIQAGLDKAADLLK